MADEADELDHARELIRIGRPYQYHPGSGHVTTPYDHPMEPAASFKDWGLARAVAIALNAINAGQLRRLADQPQLKARAEKAEALADRLAKALEPLVAYVSPTQKSAYFEVCTDDLLAARAALAEEPKETDK